ncbi:hypothetical protein H2200_008121 [Cladophialophora chaetospira]|uniref:Ankyrin repeat protein n=1 Tax=Cladophialophora chaetospira TaxID=386627 RepID=A0AA38X5I9_9EURO|nr:hypothetical protein H2200_008121 [Cladophialophora chaetospira]
MLDDQGKSLLYHALDMRVASVDTKLILLLLHHGGLVQNADSEGMTCLHYAALRNDTQLIRILLVAGFDVNVAVDRENIAVANFDTSVLVSNGRGLTPLHVAAYFCRPAATQALLEAGANPLACDAFGSSPLHLAVSPALPGRRNNDMWSEFMYMPEEIWEDPENEAEVERVLEEARNMRQSVLNCLCEALKTPNNIHDDQDRTALHWIPYGRSSIVIETVSYLLGRGHERLVQDAGGKTPIHLAAKAGDVSSVEILLTQPQDLALKDADGRMALHFAAQANHLATVDFVLRTADHLATENSIDHMGMNALHHALDGTSFAQIGVIRRLIAAGVDATHKDNFGRDPLCRYLIGPLLMPGKPDIIQALVDAGADVRYSGHGAKNLAHLFVSAWTAFELDGFLRLERAGVDVRAVNVEGQTILHRAAICGSLNATLLNHCLRCLHMDAELRDQSWKRPWDLLVDYAAKKHPPSMWMPERWKRSAAAFESYRRGSDECCQCQSRPVD